MEEMNAESEDKPKRLKSQIQETSRVSVLLCKKTKENEQICQEKKATVEELQLKHTNKITTAVYN